MAICFKLPPNSEHLSITDKFFKTGRCPLFRVFTVLTLLSQIFSIYLEMQEYEPQFFSDKQVIQKNYNTTLLADINTSACFGFSAKRTDVFAQLGLLSNLRRILRNFFEFYPIFFNINETDYFE